LPAYLFWQTLLAETQLYPQESALSSRSESRSLCEGTQSGRGCLADVTVSVRGFSSHGFERDSFAMKMEKASLTNLLSVGQA